MSHQSSALDSAQDPVRNINFTPWRSLSTLPSILQNEATECGLACIAMMSAYYGAPTDIAKLRVRVGTSPAGVTLKQLLIQADRAGLSGRVIRTVPAEMHRLRMPCILHWDMNHFVVLKKVGKKSIVVHDPRIGVVEHKWDEVSEFFTGIAVEASPNEAFVKKDDREIPTLRSIMGTNPGLYKALGQIFVLALLLQLIGLASPAAMQWMIDNGLQSGQQSVVLTIVVGMALLLVLNLAIGTVRSWMVTYLAIQVGYRWSSRVFNHLLHLPVDFFEKRHLGDIISRFGSVSAIQQTVTTGVIEGILDGLLGTALLVMIWLYSPLLAATVVASVFLLTILQFAIFEKSKRIENESLVADARVSSNMMESIRGIRSVKLGGRTDYRRVSWQNLSVDSINIRIRQEWLGIAVGTVAALISGGQRILAIYIAARMITEGNFTIGMLFAYLSYQDQFASRASNLISLYFSFKMLRLHLERLSDIVLSEPEQLRFTGESEADNASSRSSCVDTIGTAREGDIHVDFSEVSFRYSDFLPDAISGVSFSTKGHACTVITGRSGAGKTTIAKMILGIYKPTSGSIRINGIALEHLPLDAIRADIACVLQGDTLFAGSIRDNIAFFDERIEQDRAEECARIACIHDDIQRMPMGYHTLVGDMGSTLSAGQKQRVLIARALYRNPKILILDEATSDLDVPTEESINANLAKLDIHRIYIAHRPQTIRFGSQVVHLGDD